MIRSIQSYPRQANLSHACFIYQDCPFQVVLDARFENDFMDNYKELKSAFERLKILKVGQMALGRLTIHYTTP